ncbi:hypothetical protein TeGR_g14262 [Tetraparma gracilis]|uniref:Uncharacterized protein n=1 Tax=Tetraparma gracilis TaxID=2962635 RepID=A0ABQ6N3D2_9STRA|nr:hypothetical protein TeGR_g14262 [Tetraparma gracilis]
MVSFCGFFDRLAVAAPYCGVTVSRGVEKGVTLDFRHHDRLENGTGGGGGAPTADTENLTIGYTALLSMPEDDGARAGRMRQARLDDYF